MLINKAIILSAGSFILGMAFMYNLVRVRLNWYQDATKKINAHNYLVGQLRVAERRVDLLEKELKRKNLTYEVGQIVNRNV